MMLDLESRVMLCLLSNVLTIKMLKYKLFLNKLMILALCVACQSSLAQQDQTVETPSVSEQSEEQVNQQVDNDSEISNTNADDQVFIPSEEISEDAPVAFPVDI